MLVKNEEQLLENARTPELRKLRSILIEVVNRAITAVDPSSAIRRRVKLDGECLKVGPREFDLASVGRLVVVGGGKASGRMAEVLEEMLGDRITDGVVNVPEGTASKYRTRRIRLIEGGHPLPTEGGKEGAERMLDLVSGLGPQDLVVCLVSGGGSALISLPEEGISMDDLRTTNQLLLKSRAKIQEINAIRKHISKIKGGQLAKAAYPARILSLVISDVVGDRLDTISSGPTYPDPTTHSDALAVVERYGLAGKLPESVFGRLKSGAEGKVPETPKPGDEYFRGTVHEIVAKNRDAIEAASSVGRSHGFNVFVVSESMEGETHEVAIDLVGRVKRVIEEKKPVPPPALLISGGETTLEVKGGGMGGRNQEFVLTAAIELSGLKNVAVTSFGTDGIDGPTDAAGALADNFTLERARRLGLGPEDHLERNDPYPFFRTLGDLLMTGPTGTNVMDIVCLIAI